MRLSEALATAAGRIGGLDKTEENRQQGFKFRSIESITAAVRPVFAELGLSIMPDVRTVEYTQVQTKSGTVGWRCVAHVDYTVSLSADPSHAPETMTGSMVGEAVDYGDKSTSKAIQMAYKYFLTQLLTVGSGDDHDATTPTPVETVDPVAVRAGQKRQSKHPVTVLKQDLAKTWGAELAGRAWRQMFPDGDPPPTEAASTKFVEHIRLETARIVAELTATTEENDDDA